MPTKAAHDRRDERGAVAAIVVVLMAVVFMGFAAISIDVGRVMVERRELQNGADAGALALAATCAKGACEGPADLEDLVNDNAADSEHTISSICGTGLDDSCPTGSIAEITKCPPVPLAYAALPFVEVNTRSLSGSDSFIQNVFGGAAGSASTTTVAACARAGWGPIKSAQTLPLTFRSCEFEEATDTTNGGGFGPAFETALPLKYDTDAACDPLTAPSGGDFSGGFGWLENTGCIVDLEIGNWVQTQPGVGGGNQCLDDLHADQVVFIPIHDCISDSKTLCVPGSPSGNNTWYHLDGFAAFYITKIDLTGQSDGTTTPEAQAECNDESQGGGNSPGKCIFGYFIDDYVAVGGEIDPGGDPTGTWVVAPLG